MNKITAGESSKTARNWRDENSENKIEAGREGVYFNMKLGTTANQVDKKKVTFRTFRRAAWITSKLFRGKKNL